MRAFFDTNVLVCLFDGDAAARREVARSLLQQEADAGRATLSTQVLVEFFVTVTRKLAVPLEHEQAERAVRNLGEFSVVPLDAGLVFAGIELARRLQVSPRDALIVAAALQSGSTVLYTDGLQHGWRIDGLAVVDPFAGLQTR